LVKKEEIKHLLPDGLTFDNNHPYNQDNDFHPIYLEFNEQTKVRTYGFIPSPGIHEFKIQIPYVKSVD
jgi:hypothetical protein